MTGLEKDFIRSPAVAVIGDYMKDIDSLLKQVKIAPDHHVPVGVLEYETIRPGAAGAVVEMLHALNIDTLAIGEHIKQQCTKHRFFINGRPIFRRDTDFISDISMMQADDILFGISKRIEYIIVSDYGKGVITQHLWDGLLKTGKKIIVDPTIKKHLAWYKGAWAILPNAKEARVASESDAFDRCVELLAMYPHVCIKLGGAGMIVGRQSDHISRIDPIKINCIDVCGAGDMVSAALTAALMRGKSWFEACNFANQMAAKKCEQFGATPVKEEVCILI